MILRADCVRYVWTASAVKMGLRMSTSNANITWTYIFSSQKSYESKNQNVRTPVRVTVSQMIKRHTDYQNKLMNVGIGKCLP